jgi:membrane associated rhomboid family serine protease
MIIPYNTDAPIYYRPFMTIVLIVVNIICFGWEMQSDIEAIEPYMLVFGDGLHPSQWITSLFMHASISHVVGNMVFLWAFGLVVEGKLGWWKFLLSYLLIGAIESMMSQVLMLWSDYGHALGASGAIFGLLAMCLVWAPKNELHCFYWYVVFVGTTD